MNQEIESIKRRFGIIGNSAALEHAILVASQVAPTDMTVLITGESGSGKESFSKIIHNLSHRRHGQFIAINCGAIPEGTIDSELFGHEKGSFTGAHEARKGYFEVTNGGTIFLDEIGEMPLGTQARLLRVLENGEFIKVGSSKVLKTDVRVVAATNVNLLQAVERKAFRQDLYYRLNTVPIYVPSLRERGEDIELLFRKFASDFSEKYRVKPAQLSPEAKQVLLRYRFPGNIRQLKNLVEQISVLELDRTLTAEALRKYLPENSSNSLPALTQDKTTQEALSDRELLYKVLFDMRHDVNELKKMFLKVLQREHQNSTILAEHQDFFKNINTEEPTVASPRQELPVILEKPQPNAVLQIDAQEEAFDRVEDITHEEEDDTLSLEKKEKELIIKALSKNKNKRKHAAADLGISERTLYRKIKQYAIEEL